MECRDCGAVFQLIGSIVLCDRCLCAKLWRLLEEDDYVMLRRRGENIWLESNHNGTRESTNLSYFKRDPLAELAMRAEAVFH